MRAVCLLLAVAGASAFSPLSSLPVLRASSNLVSSASGDTPPRPDPPPKDCHPDQQTQFGRRQCRPLLLPPWPAPQPRRSVIALTTRRVRPARLYCHLGRDPMRRLIHLAALTKALSGRLLCLAGRSGRVAGISMMAYNMQHPKIAKDITEVIAQPPGLFHPPAVVPHTCPRQSHLLFPPQSPPPKTSLAPQLTPAFAHPAAHRPHASRQA